MEDGGGHLKFLFLPKCHHFAFIKVVELAPDTVLNDDVYNVKVSVVDETLCSNSTVNPVSNTCSNMCI